MRHIKPELVTIIDNKLKNNGSAQLALNDKDARSLLVYAAEACVGEHEQGYNKGEFVELCQKTVDNYAKGESWCMAFVESMIAYVETKLGITSPISSSENCLVVWENTPDVQIVQNYPLRGAIVIWRHINKSTKKKNPSGLGKRDYKYKGSGHTGFVVEYNSLPTAKKMTTIEGNTNDSGSSNGDGVYYKTGRDKIKEGGNSDLEVVGFLIPFTKTV